MLSACIDKPWTDGTRRILSNMAFESMLWSLFTLTFAATGGSSLILPRQDQPSIPTQTYLIFGDSYSDDCNAWRIRADPDLSGQYAFPACPPPTLYSSARSTGGYIWPEMLRNGSQVEVLNFAVSGATCSNSLYPRNITATGGAISPLPAVDMQIDTFQEYNSTLQEAKDFTALIFIGTNDLGMYFSGFQDGTPAQSTSSNITVDQEAVCVVQQVQRLLQTGVQKVVVLNTTPLQYTALFSQDQVSEPGSQVTQNGPLTALLMKQLVFANNALQRQLLVQLNTDISPGSGQEVSIYDTYSYFESLLLNPPESAYGSEPNITGFSSSCCEIVQAAGCVDCADPRAFFYFDQLHPSEVTSQLLAQDLARYLNLSYGDPLP